MIENKQISRVNPLVPKLDFTKIFEWRDKQNRIEKENAIKQWVQQELDEDIELSIREEYVGSELDHENYEEPTSIAQTFKRYYPSGGTIDSSKTISVMRKEVLMKRKAEVINELNETYTQSENPTDHNNDQYDHYDKQQDSSDIDIELIKNELMYKDSQKVNKNKKNKPKRNDRSNYNPKHPKSHVKESKGDTLWDVDNKDTDSEFIHKWMEFQNISSREQKQLENINIDDDEILEDSENINQVDPKHRTS